jgi:hypothetical protein
MTFFICLSLRRYSNVKRSRVEWSIVEWSMDEWSMDEWSMDERISIGIVEELSLFLID